MLTCTDGRNCTLGLVVVVIRYAVRSTPEVIAVYLDVTVLSGISVVLHKIRYSSLILIRKEINQV